MRGRVAGGDGVKQIKSLEATTTGILYSGGPAPELPPYLEASVCHVV